MEDTNNLSNPLNNLAGSSTPPAPPTTEVVVPGSASVPDSFGAKSPEWPVKKKKRFLPIFGGVMAILLIVGVAFGAFYFTKNLNQAATPTAPTSDPMAANPGCTFHPEKCGVNEYCVNNVCKRKGGGGIDDGIPNTSCSSASTGKCQGKSSGDACGDGGKCWALAGQTGSDGKNKCSCDGENTGTTEVITTCTDSSWTPDPALSCVGTNVTQTSNCGTTKVVPGTKNCQVACTDLATQTVAKTSLTPGEKTNVVCDFGKVADCIHPVQGTTWSSCVYKSVSGTAYTFECTASSNVGSYTSNCGLFKSTTCTADGVSCAGSPVNITVATAACTATAPTAPSVVKISPTSVKLKWTPGANGTHIRLFVSKSSTPVPNCNGVAGYGTATDCFLRKIDIPASATEYTLTGLAEGTKYYWKIHNNVSDTCNVSLATVENFTTDTTQATGEPDVTMSKTVYKDATGNKAGEYTLTSEIDTVSKDQVIVFALKVANEGTAKAENITVTDILKTNNLELLTLVDAETRCTYATSTRKVTCSGMNLDPDKSGTYTFRVKVSSGAVNGDTITNSATATYKDMPTGGEVESSTELLISTVVGCNHVCTTDTECSTGLSCDTDTGKCRKPACTDESDCNCPVVDDSTDDTTDDTADADVTDTPTKKITKTAKKTQPTVLPETGILDFPGVAAFGGGLLLAIVGILLAL